MFYKIPAALRDVFSLSALRASPPSFMGEKKWGQSIKIRAIIVTVK